MNIRLRFPIALVLMLALPATARCAESDAVPADPAAVAQDFDRFLEFVGGSSLDAGERATIAAETQRQLRTNVADVNRADGLIRKLLAAMPQTSAADLADRRAALRLQFELQPESDPARRIVEAHDPVVAFDRARKLLVTEHTLSAWRGAYTWIAGVLDIAGPPEDFIATERDYVKAKFAVLSEADASAIADVERNAPVAEAVFAAGDRAKLAAWAKQARPVALATPLGERPLGVAQICAGLEAAETHKLFEQRLVLYGSANYYMLYHAGYQSGIFR